MTSINSADSVLAIIDMQEKLLPAIHDGQAVLRSVSFLTDVAYLMNVPVVLTEQYPRGLGSTIAELNQHPAIIERLEKIRFGAGAELMSSSSVASRGAPVVVLVGIETHVCIQQTALQLLAESVPVVLISDACGSRFSADHVAALERMRQAGVVITTAEALAFEWCETAGTDVFKQLSGLVKRRLR